jgi:hypothetical protein
MITALNPVTLLCRIASRTISNAGLPGLDGSNATLVSQLSLT